MKDQRANLLILDIAKQASKQARRKHEKISPAIQRLRARLESS
jgi:hypothetical protein